MRRQSDFDFAGSVDYKITQKKHVCVVKSLETCTLTKYDTHVMNDTWYNTIDLVTLERRPAEVRFYTSWRDATKHHITFTIALPTTMSRIANMLGSNGPNKTKDAHFLCVAEHEARAAASDLVSSIMRAVRLLSPSNKFCPLRDLCVVDIWSHSSFVRGASSFLRRASHVVARATITLHVTVREEYTKAVMTKRSQLRRGLQKAAYATLAGAFAFLGEIRVYSLQTPFKYYSTVAGSSLLAQRT